MNRRCTRFALILLAALVSATGAPATEIRDALRAEDWPAAQALAAREPDPLAGKLVTFLRLLSPGQAGAQEIAAFSRANPGWPYAALLRRRYGEALTRETDDGTVLALCTQALPALDAALMRCAAAAQAMGQPETARSWARAAWIGGIVSPSAEQAFLARWDGTLDEAAQQRRFEALAWKDEPAAARQAARLGPGDREVALARLAFHRNDAAALDLLAAVPPARRADPALVLDQARFFRAQTRLDAAVSLWRGAGFAAEAKPGANVAAFWKERDRLARLLLDAGQDADAYALADDEALPPEQAVDADFLAGWIALRRLHDPERARARFMALQAISPAAITQGRAWYWLARAAPDEAASHADYQHAALYPFTYYGQLACRALGEAGPDARIRAWPDPSWPQEDAIAFAGAEKVRAAGILAGWGEASRARGFLLAEARTDPPPGYDQVLRLALTARMALELGLPDVAVSAARMAGRLGYVLPHAGWPAPFSPPADPEEDLVLGVARQESSFDPAIVSAAGAVGLMQMMPATARDLGGGPGLTDAAENFRLGTLYLHQLLDQFGGVKPYAVAAYNAGPRHVREWMATHGDASTGPADAMVDWIELIPFNETRNYVQRVLENEAVYASLTR